MYRVSGKEYSLVGRELCSDPLSDLVSSPPVEFAIVEFIGCDDALRGLQDGLGSDFGSIDSSTSTITDLLRCRKLDIQTDKFVLARNHHHTPSAGGMDGTTHSDIREVGNRDYVENSPDVVCRFALQLKPSWLRTQE